MCSWLLIVFIISLNVDVQIFIFWCLPQTLSSSTLVFYLLLVSFVCLLLFYNSLHLVHCVNGLLLAAWKKMYCLILALDENGMLASCNLIILMICLRWSITQLLIIMIILNTKSPPFNLFMSAILNLALCNHNLINYYQC